MTWKDLKKMVSSETELFRVLLEYFAPPESKDIIVLKGLSLAVHRSSFSLSNRQIHHFLVSKLSPYGLNLKLTIK